MPISIKASKTLVTALYPGVPFERFSEQQVTTLKKVAKTLIERAIKEGLTPSKVLLDTEHDFVGHITINILPKYNRTIIAYSRDEKCPAAVVALGLLANAMNHDWHLEYCSLAPSAPSLLDGYLAPLGYSERSEQARFYSYVEDAVSSGKVGLVEASTGVGKTLAILVSANERALSSSVSVIATNSIDNMMTYLSDYQAMLNAGISMAPIHVLLGRQNFVSVSRLENWLEQVDCPINSDDAMSWVNMGGRSVTDGDLVPPFTVESLSKVCPEIIPGEVSLSTHESSSDKGALSYAEQFEAARASESCVLLVSHAMLCIDIRLRLLRHGLEGDVALTLKEMGDRASEAYQGYLKAGEDEKSSKLEQYLSLSRSYREAKMAAIDETGVSLIPNYAHLYVDEGHLLEGAMANAISANVSIRGLMRDIYAAAENGTFPKSRLGEASKLVDKLVEKGSDSGGGRVILTNQTHDINSLIIRLCETLSGARSRKGNKSWLDLVAHLRRAVDFNHQQKRFSVLDFSPVRAYPSISTGEIDCGRYFSSMWSRVESAVVVSATLYIKRYNAYSCSYMRRLLNIDSSRLGQYPPVCAKWIKDTVKTVYLPSEYTINDDSLMPIGRQFQGSQDEKIFAKEVWSRSLSGRIQEAYNRSAGGVLVLMTSYEEVSLLVNNMPPSMPLVFASSENTLPSQKEEFIRLSKDGQKPLWIALGGAWVGMDVSGKDIGLSKELISTDDNVLTTLIIAKIPFGLNLSLSHKVRSVKGGRDGDIELMDTLMRLKQGLGRLVRLEGQPKNREIYLLDGRFNHPRYRGYMSPVHALFDTYPNVEYLEN